jgi:hypothetical protein
VSYELSAAQEDEMDPAYEEEMRDRARKSLIEQCAIDGEIRNDYLQFCRECRVISIADYVKDLEQTGHDWWQLEVQAMWDELDEAAQ